MSRKIDKAVNVMFGLLFTGLLIALIGCFFGMFAVEPLAKIIALVGVVFMLAAAVIAVITIWCYVFTS